MLRPPIAVATLIALLLVSSCRNDDNAFQQAPLPILIDLQISWTVPDTITHDCSVDVSEAFRLYLEGLPDNAIVTLPRGACYRLDEMLEIDRGTHRNTHKVHWTVVNNRERDAMLCTKSL